MFYDKDILIENYSGYFKQMYESSIDVFEVQIMKLLIFIFLLLLFLY